MTLDRWSTTPRPMTPQHVLEVFRAWQRSLSTDDQASAIHFDMTIEEWQEELDLYDDLKWNQRKWVWRTVTDAFCVSIPYPRWKSVVQPERSKRVRDLCELIASEAVVEEIRPISVFGQECPAAGAFLAVRSALAKAGVDVSHLRPSTPLGPLLKRHGMTLWHEMTKLAPGRLPPLDVKEHPVVTTSLALIALGVLSLVAALPAAFCDVRGLAALCLAGTGMIFLGIVGATVAVLLPRGRATIGHLQTVRDLCYALIAEDATDINLCGGSHDEDAK